MLTALGVPWESQFACLGEKTKIGHIFHKNGAKLGQEGKGMKSLDEQTNQNTERLFSRFKAFVQR